MLDLLAPGKQPPILRSAPENLTPGNLLSAGMYICYECGYLNSIDNHRCSDCHAGKFIVALNNALPQTSYARPLVQERPQSIRFFLSKMNMEIFPKHFEVRVPLPTRLKKRKRELLTNN